jgi:hypothetical protein
MSSNGTVTPATAEGPSADRVATTLTITVLKTVLRVMKF